MQAMLRTKRPTGFGPRETGKQSANPLLREAGKVAGGAGRMGCGKQDCVDEGFAVIFVQSDFGRASGPHPIRRFAPPSPAKAGEGVPAAI